ncbi:hypothetical protein GCM10025789_30330 [Tessaracoccus lubricantis]|uniref:Uncharacterized protein n=1 Tax=Tessaracoccus lubricantis TaxID=545543 RepID=A0ABP9FMF8_9ACTN
MYDYHVPYAIHQERAAELEREATLRRLELERPQSPTEPKRSFASLITYLVRRVHSGAPPPVTPRPSGGYA